MSDPRSHPIGWYLLNRNAFPTTDTEVEVLIPEPQERSLPEVLEALDRAEVGEVLSVEEVAELVHEVRASQR